MAGFRTGRPDMSGGGGGAGALISILPSLPATADQGTGSLTGVTCTRTGIRSCVKDDGTVVKLTTNQLAVEANGILVEQGATNLSSFSEAYDTVGVWQKAGNTSSPTMAIDTVTAPDGTLTAESLTHNQNVIVNPGSFSILRYQNSAPVVNGSTYVWTTWLRNGTVTAYPSLYINDGVTAGGKTAFALTTSWQRFGATHTVASTTSNHSVGYFNEVANVTGQLFYVWGGQLELGYAHAYVPTTSGSSSSAADVVTIINPLSGTSAAFTFAASFTPTYSRTWESRTGTIALWQLGTSGANNSIAVSRNSSNQVVVVLQDNAGGTKTYTSVSTLTGATTKRISYAHVPGTGGTVSIDGVDAGGSWAGAGTGIVTQSGTLTLGRHAGVSSTMLDGHVYNIVMTA